MMWQFIPFCIYFTCIVMFTTLANAHNFSLDKVIQIRKSGEKYTNYVREGAGYLMAILALYFLFFSLIHFKSKSDFAAKSMIVYHFFVLATFALNFSDPTIFPIYEGDVENGNFHFYIMICSITIAASYFVLLRYLRIFGPFAVYTNIIYYSLKDTIYYNIILVIGAFGFTNSMHILAMLEEPDRE
jgi:hypothetical protein